jgi:RNA polymerase sigma-70 factor (ECF subfamily)
MHVKKAGIIPGLCGVLWKSRILRLEVQKVSLMTDSPDNPMGLPPRSISDAPQQQHIRDESESNESDDSLLRRVSEQDQSAMAKLFDRYGGMVYSVALRVLRDTGSAEDLLQEVFFQLWRNPTSFVSSRGSLGAWLLVVARNRAIDILRRRRPMESVDDHPLSSRENLASDVERSAMMQKVRSVLTVLPPEQRNAVELAYFEGLSQTEIADRTGDPLGTVKTRIRLALISLRKALQA